jgi:hypothetical protein
LEGKRERKNKRVIGAGGMAQVVEFLNSKCISPEFSNIRIVKQRKKQTE